MRAACVGLRYPWAHQRHLLVAAAIESCRVTHHHPTAYLGAVTAALFVAYAIEGIPVTSWGRLLLSEGVPLSRQYIQHSGRETDRNLAAFGYFIEAWQSYLKPRGLAEEGACEAVFPSPYGIVERGRFYREISFRGWGGASGHDSVIIAYDAVLGARGCWDQLCRRGVLHGGDNDSTGTVACAWWGALHGFAGVPRCNWCKVEGCKDSVRLGRDLHSAARADQAK